MEFKNYRFRSREYRISGKKKTDKSEEQEMEQAEIRSET